MLQHLIIQFTLYYDMSSASLQKAKKKKKCQISSSKIGDSY